ncbi:unnamed protein product [Allacma fusca]|uniref:Uncharacterized protein n=1 Tax=Allacma fusca TaxID=39272 RepID=A0A8J2P5T2_9HEXA|nr:unnamed protein product [Allacma fusca]
MIDSRDKVRSVFNEAKKKVTKVLTRNSYRIPANLKLITGAPSETFLACTGVHPMLIIFRSLNLLEYFRVNGKERGREWSMPQWDFHSGCKVFKRFQTFENVTSDKVYELSRKTLDTAFHLWLLAYRCTHHVSKISQSAFPSSGTKFTNSIRHSSYV